MKVAFFLYREQRFLLGLRPSRPHPPQAPQATLEPHILLVPQLAFLIPGPTVGHHRRRGPLCSRGSDWYLGVAAAAVVHPMNGIEKRKLTCRAR